ncbi:MAG: branched-chain amino acid aminotransferase [Alistipes sp.]|nr:branched-chain amino acid aminotransferase [Alistipes sp.]MBR2332426.1 branched-chain amino acid aminotransferase [Alistipes sp.]
MVNIDWKNLGFDYVKTNVNARFYYKDGVWSEMEITDDEYIKMHMSTTCLHYGLECFEGLKAFRGVDGKVRLFRADENAKRMQASARKLCLPVPSVEMFVDACREVVSRNIDFVPPYESGASLYLRPVLIGSKVGLGVKASPEAMFIVFCSPVGPYFKGGMKPIKVVVDRMQDRAAPRGTGDIKAGGNYASSILSGEKAHDMGYSNVMYLDATEHKYIEECGAANFFGIKNGTYVTPKSPSILPSITNKSLRTLAEDMGLKVEERPVAVDELGEFEEAGACGTAAVISPIESVYDLDTDVKVSYGGEVGKWSLALYNSLQDIQYGRAEDKFGWTIVVE